MVRSAGTYGHLVLHRGAYGALGSHMTSMSFKLNLHRNVNMERCGVSGDNRFDLT